MRLSRPIRFAVATTVAVTCLAVLAQALPFGQLSPDLAAKRAVGLSNLKQITVGVLIYQSDFDDVLPYAQNTRTVAYVTQPYMKNRKLWSTLNPKGSMFAYNVNVGGVVYSGPPPEVPGAAKSMPAGRTPAVPNQAIPKPAQTPLFYETKEWPDGGRLVSFVDGHARVVPASGWPAVKKALTWRFKRTTKPLPAHYGDSFRFPDEPG